MSDHRSVRRGWKATVAAAVVVGAVAVGGGAAQAGPEPQCVGSECNGLKPAADGCLLDATVVNREVFQDNASGGTSATLIVRLVYSPTCDASWARVTVRGTGTADVTGARAWVQGHRTATLRNRPSGGTFVSNMWSASSISVCGRGNWNNGAAVETRCTGAG